MFLKFSALGSVYRISSISRTRGEIDDKSYLLILILKPASKSLGMLPDFTKNSTLCLLKADLLKSQTKPIL